MKIAILHQHVPEDALPDERDVLVEAEAVQAALQRLGHTTIVLPVDLDLKSWMFKLRKIDFAFNLVETFGGTGRLQHFVPNMLDMAPSGGIRYAGNSGDALMITSHKVMAKQIMKHHGIPVPPLDGDGPFIVKPIGEDASIGIDDRSVVPDRAAADLLLAERKGRRWFAEAYVEGREINVSLLDGVVLPPAEVHFEGDWNDRPKIIGYAAKWEPASFEYQNSVRRIGIDAKTSAAVTELALRCWSLFDLNGWARVDFRVTETGDPFVLEVNANPCLSPDAGFAASLAAAGISFDRAVEIIVQAGLTR